MEKEYYIKVNDWTKVPVTEEIYRCYRRQQWNESKRRKIRADMEYSYELMVESAIDGKCASKQKLTEDIVMDKLLLELLMEALDTLNSDERILIDGLYFLGETERELSSHLGVSQQLLHYHKKEILNKLKKLLKTL